MHVNHPVACEAASMFDGVHTPYNRWNLPGLQGSLALEAQAVSGVKQHGQISAEDRHKPVKPHCFRNSCLCEYVAIHRGSSTTG